MTTESTDTAKKPTIVCRDEDSCEDLDLKLSRAWLRIAIAGVFAGQGMMFSLALNMTPPPYGSLPYMILHGGLIFSSVIVMAFLGGPLFASTWGMLRARRLSIEGLFTISLLGAFVGSLVGSITGRGDVFYEVVAIVVAIYTFGRMLGERSQAMLKLESAKLRERYDHVIALDEAGHWRELPVGQVSLGDLVRVSPGSAFSVDGFITEGVGYVQETALTGEPLPVVKRAGDRVRAGTWSIDSLFEVEVGKGEGARELDTILSIVESAGGQPSELQTQANRLVQVFLPVVVAVGALTAIYWGLVGTWVDAVLNSMAVLLVACPCALGLATPVAISNGLLRLARIGLISREGKLVDVLARTKKIFFDKTGTLSESNLRVAELWVSEDLPFDREVMLHSVSLAESSVDHPVASAIVHYLDQLDHLETPAQLTGLRILSGQGIESDFVFGEQAFSLQIGETELCTDSGAITGLLAILHDPAGKIVSVLHQNQILAAFVLKEHLREGVDRVWQQLGDLNVDIQILTGDPNPQVQINQHVESGLNSSEKELRVRKSKESGEVPIFIGDGINDVVAMASASGSISMHAGTGLTRSVAMGQLSSDQILVVPRAIQLARQIHRRLRGNLYYAFAYNLFGMGLAAFGLLHPVVAAAIMLISSFFVTARVLSLKEDNY